MGEAPIIINVDDQEYARYVKGRILSRAGFTVHDAANGADALELTSMHSPDLVLLDIHLPDINGIEVCRRIKAEPESASVIVLQISSTATVAPQATAALDSGADAYLAEPVDPDVLISTVRALLRIRKMERELFAANERLSLVNEELRRSNTDLQQFAFAASHDLQEPLKTVTSFASLLERAAPKLTPNEKRYLKYIVDGSNRMRGLIDDLLSYSQLGHQPDASQIVDLNSVLPWVLENLSDGIAKSGAEITSDPLPSVTGDEAQLGLVFQNLIVNAIKYARSGVKPVIHISAAQQDQCWLIQVADNGMGISMQHREVIFSPFKRLHGKEIPGTGLGLAVCRKVIETHGGRIWVEDSAGGGTTFALTLPVANV